MAEPVTPAAEPAYLVPRDDIASEAFDLWALLQATNARLVEMQNEGPIHEDGCGELSRLIRCASTKAHAIGMLASG